MRRLQFKFPSQIRISGWDFGSSARAMNQAGGKDSLMTYENESIPQADLVKVTKSTTERKSMSTKTTIKRIALVAVSALGLGVLTSVAPASAGAGGYANAGTLTIGSMSVASASATGETVTVAVPLSFNTSTTTSDTFIVSYSLASVPSTSALTTNARVAVGASGSVTRDTNAVSKNTCTITPSSNNDNIDTFTVSTGTCSATTTLTRYFSFKPDVAGVYTVQAFEESQTRTGTTYDANAVKANGIRDNGEVAKTITITVVDSPAASVALTQPVAGTGATDQVSDEAGLWVKLSLKDASGAASRLGRGQQAVVTVPAGLTLAKVNGTTVGLTNGTYGVSDSQVYGDGSVWLNFTTATAGTYSVSAYVGTSATSVVTLTYAAASAIAVASAAYGLSTADTALNIEATSGAVNSSGSAATIPTTATASSYTVYSAAASKYVLVRITDTAQKIFASAGNINSALTQDIVVLTGTTAGATASTTGYGKYAGSFSLPAVTMSTNSLTGAQDRTFVLSTQPTDVTTTVGTSTLPLTVTGTTASASYWTVKPATVVSVINGGTVTFTATCYDVFDSAMASRAATAQITAGRNVQALSTALITDAAGAVTFTVTDAAPTSATTSDTVTFTGCGTDKSVTINYVSSLTASTLTMSPVTTSTAPSSSAISTASATASASANLVTVTATAADAAGNPVIGLPVTLTVPAGVSLKSTTPALAYTSSTGVATWSVYTTLAGSYKLTATGGGLTKDVYLKRTGGTARVVSVTAGTTANGVTPVTIKVADAYGNGVASSPVEIQSSGSGYFQGIALGSSQTTTSDGTISVAYVGNGTITATISGGQSADVAGYIGTTAATGFPAGVATASATIDSASSPASDAVDAANEATDAANAATDAANAAAEAADAATAAAQDAQAAVAALATSVATLIAGIKAQITTLTNLVIKIQKKVKA